MNTPRTKPIKRYGTYQGKRSAVTPDGHYRTGLPNANFAALIGQIITYMPSLEERMIDFMKILGGETMPARHVFRAIKNDLTRLTVLKAMLELAPQNKRLGREYDEIIDLFDTVRKKRNAYAHGLWYTHTDSARVFLAEAAADEMSFLEKREVTTKELEGDIARMNDLWDKIIGLVYPKASGEPQSSPKNSPQPRGEGNT